MDEFERWLSSTNDDPLLVAIEAHYRLVTIHPFVDGNGRTARLLFNLLLLQSDYPLSFVEKKEREQYIKNLEMAQL